jgi:hypothetical protein
MSGIATDLLLRAVEAALLQDEQGTSIELTPDVGALVRDKGMSVGLEAAKLRHRIGFLTDVANCAEYVLPRHRRRLK